jgi:TM2 domain-containing membrane protein YozV/ribosomal protein L40E
MAVKTCRACGSASTPDAVFCEHCGAPFEAMRGSSVDEKICKACGSASTPDAVFCEHCGASFSSGVGQQPVAQQPVAQQPYQEQQPSYTPQQKQALPKKSPGLAAVLSVVPGLGQCYLGDYRRGAYWFFGLIIISFIIYFILGATSLWPVVFWLANLADAYRQARNYNRRLGYEA